MKRLRFLEGIKHIRLAKSASYALLGALVVLVGTFAAWQFTKIFSPTTDINPGGIPTIILKTSDHDISDNPLPNSIAETTQPDYGDQGQVILLPIINGIVQLPRTQGEVTFE